MGNLRRVAGKARICHVAAEGDLFGLMRVFVALEAAAEFVMGFAFVALTTERDDILHGWRVTIVTVLTGYLCLVGTAFCFYISRSLYMAFGAVGTCKGN